MRTYYGFTIEPAGINSSGIRWIAYCGHGRTLKSDTLAGIKCLIREIMKGVSK